jgi:hypothetical protein
MTVILWTRPTRAASFEGDVDFVPRDAGLTVCGDVLSAEFRGVGLEVPSSSARLDGADRHALREWDWVESVVDYGAILRWVCFKVLLGSVIKFGFKLVNIERDDSQREHWLLFCIC